MTPLTFPSFLLFAIHGSRIPLAAATDGLHRSANKGAETVSFQSAAPRTALTIWVWRTPR